jgi:putative toxin-antitoxin system antitoxin component (TIGR02293 family)
MVAQLDNGSVMPATTAKRRSAGRGRPVVQFGRVHDAAERIFRATPLERIEIVRRGVPAGFVVRLGSAMGVPKERVYQTIGLPRSTAERKARAEQSLSPDESERVVGLTQLIGQVQAMVEQSGDPEGFEAARWVGHWLDRPHPALGNRKPGELCDTAEGRTVVSNLLARQQSGAYA